MNNKQIGSQWEREVCKSLSLWLTQGKKDDIFWRSAMSGGRATIGKSGDRKAQAGDISAVSEEGITLCNKYYIECKNYNSLNFSALITKGEGTLAQIFLENLKDAKKYKKDLLIIAKQKRFPPIIMAKKGVISKVADLPISIKPHIIRLGKINADILGFDILLSLNPSDNIL